MSPKLLAMLHIQPPIMGDEALLRFAQARLGEAGIGGELYPGAPEHLRALLDFRPEGLASTAHLPRHIDLFSEAGRDEFMAYAQVAAGQLYGVLVHDQRAFEDDLGATVSALRALDGLLQALPDAPLAFIEYAAFLEPDVFARLFEETAELERVCPCIDVGHVAIYVCRAAYAEQCPGEDVCALSPHDPALAAHIDAVQEAVRRTPPAVTALVTRLARLGKPLHFHLHDGHPLSTLSDFGVSDHLSFLQQVRLPFAYEGRRTLGGIFGPTGLQALLRAALDALPAEKLSFMLEIHPQPGRKPLGEDERFFRHWADKDNAEQMSYWLETLLENAALVRASSDRVSSGVGG